MFHRLEAEPKPSNWNPLEEELFFSVAEETSRAVDLAVRLRRRTSRTTTIPRAARIPKLVPTAGTRIDGLPPVTGGGVLAGAVAPPEFREDTAGSTATGLAVGCVELASDVATPAGTADAGASERVANPCGS